MSDSNKEFSFTKKRLDKLETGGNYKDTHDQANGLKLRFKIDSGTKSFFVIGRPDGSHKPVTVSLGTYPKTTIEQARKKARATQADFSNGINPNSKKKFQRTKQSTLAEMFEAYLLSKALKPSTIKGYRSSFKNVLSPLVNTPVTEIDYNKVLKVHKAYAKRSQAEADRAMRLLKAIINMAMDDIRDLDGRPVILENPVRKLGKNRHMKKLDRKVSKLEDDQIKPFLDTMEAMSSDSRPFFQVGADLSLMLFYHGTRFSEMARMKWQQVDFRNKRFYLDETKNGRRLWLPMNSESETVLKRRKKLSTGSEYVFTSVTDNGKAISDIKKPLRELLESTGIKITPHDFRRTFLGMGARLGFNDSILKQLANHATGSDVTTGYLIQSADELKEPSQRVANRFLELAGKAVNDSDSQINELLNGMDEAEKQRLLIRLMNSKQA
jgi:integrase